MTDIAVGFRDADGEMLKDLAQCRDFLNDMAFFRSYKARTLGGLERQKRA